ncbi:DNA-binding protein [Streptomyces sp. NPDC088732]|uniref:DNA-binding protein n=1 Tax=Streptomyces sp. NPDC088732 TaxID=3365879 RepID=UPI00381F732E
MKTTVRAKGLSISEALAHESPLMDLPTFFKACGIAESTGYQLAAEGRLPLEVITLGRRRFVRTTSAWRFLGLIAEESGVVPEVQSGAPATEHDDAPGVQPGAPVEHITARTAK